MARFKIYAALTEDVNQGWVWLDKSKLPHGSPQRSIVKLLASDTSKYVYCETRFIDDNFEYDYNPPDDNNDDKKSCRLKRCRRRRIPDQKIGEVVAVRATSFFIPPLGAVKTGMECHYQVGYMLKKGDRLIRKKVLSVALMR